MEFGQFNSKPESPDIYMAKVSKNRKRERFLPLRNLNLQTNSGREVRIKQTLFGVEFHHKLMIT